MSLIASCHCGATKFELASEPTEAHRCNCSYCQRAGAVWADVPPGTMTLLVNDAEGTYAPQEVNVHHFCTKCGMQTWGESPNWSSIYNNDGTLKEGMTEGIPEERTRTVNLNLVDGIDWSKITITEMDGRNNW